VRASAVEFFQFARGKKPDKILRRGEQGLNLRKRVKFQKTAF